MKALTRPQVLKLESIWHANFQARAMPAGGMAEAWFRAVTEFLCYEGTDQIPEEIILLENSIIEKGLSDEYIKTLFTFIKAPDDLEESEKLVFLLSVTSKERERALKFVLAI